MQRSNGYILKFYKKIKNLTNGNSDFDFVSFMNFDGVKILAVDSFSDYQKNTIDFDSPQEYDKDCSRQKLLIYDFIDDYSNLDNDKENIFDKDQSDFSKKYPVLAISIVNLKRTANQKESMDMVKSILDSKNLKYKIFGSLSINNFVIVYRCKNFSDLFNCNIYSLYPKSENIHSTYTIPCLLLCCAKYWKEKNGLEISIRSSVLPQNNYYNMNNSHKASINGKRILGLKRINKYNVLGKYDLDVRGTIDSPKKFIENFDEGIFGQIAADKDCLIRNTNTRFLYKCKPGVFENNIYQPDKINKTIMEFQDRVSNISSEIICKHSESSDFNQNLARLWLRSYQLLIRGRNSPMLDDICRIIETYFKLTNAYIDDLDYAESIISGLKSLNTLIDNRDLNDFYEFENPHSNLMFSGCNTALLSAYSNMADKAFSFIRHMNNDPKEYVSYITCDGYAEVSAKELFMDNDFCYFINIRIPTELMFDFKNLVCFILHEIGHNWNYLNNNDSELLEMYLDISLRQQLIEIKNEKNLSSNEDIDAIKDGTINSISNITQLRQNTFKALTKILLQTNVCDDLTDAYQVSEKIVSDINQFDSALEETIADIFMIKFVGIMSAEAYLNIVVDYLKYKNIQLTSPDICNENFIETIFMRATIVLIMLLSNSVKNIHDTLIEILTMLKKYIDKAEKTEDIYKINFGKLLFASLCNDIDSNPIKNDVKASTLYHYAHKIYQYAILPKNTKPSDFRKKLQLIENSNIHCVQEKFGKYLDERNDYNGFQAIIDFINSMNSNDTAQK